MRHQLINSARTTILRSPLGRSTALPTSRIFTQYISNTSRSMAEKKSIERSPEGRAASQVVHNNNNGDLPAFSFEGLGISKNMKIFLVALLSIFGTIETWFWCKAIWHWWKGESEDGAETS
ncbi:hypothetical protein PT974_12302 [Cladobotryum mycophilum]|uniref:Uncharacterized protein n=1 Tax=Cladobotryum mycophilum TaxID=491253 RepID=A0ABR0S7L5_9HYPO